MWVSLNSEFWNVQIAGEDMSETIHDELSSDLREALRGIVDIAKDMSSYFAKKLHCAMKGAGTDEDELILVIVSRSEVTLCRNLIQQTKPILQGWPTREPHAALYPVSCGSYVISRSPTK